jgi:hypothetical protein
MHLSPRRGGHTSGNQFSQSNRCPNPEKGEAGARDETMRTIEEGLGD